MLATDLLQCVSIEHNLSQLCSRPDISTDTDCGHHSCYRGRYIILFSPGISAEQDNRAFFRVYIVNAFSVKTIRYLASKKREHEESAFNAFYSSKQYSESRALLRANESQASIELQPIKLSVI